jgi:hypothetical protein
MTPLLDRILGRATDSQSPTSTEIPATVAEAPATGNVLMRFLTLGGATVDVYAQAWTVRLYSGGEAREQIRERGFQWVCRGCDQAGKDHRLGRGYAETEPNCSRDAANDHAAECRAMSKPTF